MRKSHENFTSLHNRLYGKLFSFVRLRIKDKDEVEDIVQDTFLKAYSSWTEIPDEASARNFLYIIARQRMIDIWRSAKNRLQTDLLNKNNEDGDDWVDADFDQLPSESPLPEDLFEESETKDKVLGLLNNLKDSDREILTLRFLQELEYAELARIYKTSEDNVRKKVSRSLENLRKVAKEETNK